MTVARRTVLVVMLIGVGCAGEDGDSNDSGPAVRKDSGQRPDSGTRDTGSRTDTGPQDADLSDANPADADQRDTGGGDADSPDVDPGDGGGDGGAQDADLMDAGSILDGGALDAGLSYALTVETSSGGAVSSTPSGINCSSAAGASCTASYPEGAAVLLTATPTTTFELSHWSGDCSGTTSTQSVTLIGDRFCRAEFLSLGGEITLIPPPLSVVPNDTEDNVNIMIFLEQSNFVLQQDYPLDITVPAAWTVYPEDRTVLPAGLSVSIYYVHFDPVTTANRVATLTFPHEIYGLQVATDTLTEGDAISGNPNVLYPAAGTHQDRQLELNGQDQMTLHPNRRTLSIDYNTTTSADAVRVVVVVPPDVVPDLVSEHIGLITPPASVLAGATGSSTVAFVFEESDQIVLTQDLAVDATVPGHYASVAALTAGTIVAGSTVSAMMIHFDPNGSSAVGASLRFDRPILGLIVRSAPLLSSDYLGATQTTYPATAGSRGMELGTNERIIWSADGRSLWLRAAATSAQDQIRVILSP